MSSGVVTSQQALAFASRPCALCGGREHAVFPDNGFEKAEGSWSFYFEVVVCRTCEKTTLFARNRVRLERELPHLVVTAR
jgi:hypothetical protein